MNLETLGDVTELRQSLLKHGAKHHKKCYELFCKCHVTHSEDQHQK